MTMQLSGWIRDNQRTPVVGATINAYAATTPGDPGGAALYTTTSDANGYWTITGMTTQLYDVKADSAGFGFWEKGLTDWNLSNLVVGGTSAPAVGALQVLAGGMSILAGNLGVNAPLTSNVAALLKGTTNDSTAYALAAQRNDGTNVIYARNDGSVLLATSGGSLGFFGSAGSLKGSVTGSRGGNAALASLITYLANMGILTDGSSA